MFALEKQGETELYIVGEDGLIKLYKKEEGEYQQKRSFYVTDKGILKAQLLRAEETMVIATQDNQIILFSFNTGTQISKFSAHENTITGVGVSKEHLITCSLDSTIKIREITNVETPYPILLYDHEEGVLSMDVGSEDGKDFLVSIDINRHIVL